MELYKRDTERPDPIGYDKNRASKLMDKYDLDVLILNMPENVFYASGLPVLHQAKNPILFALRNQYPFIAIIFRDGSESAVVWEVFDKRLTWIEDVKGCLDPNEAVKALRRLLKKKGFKSGNIGVDSFMPFYQYEYLNKKFSEANFSIADDLIMDMRLIKTDEEIKRITESTIIAEKAILKMIEATEVGITDNELLKIGKIAMIEEGAEGWDHLTMSIGDSDPEAPGTGIKVQNNQVTRYDLGAMYKGYVSDVNRHAFVGKIPEELDNVVNILIDVQNACQKAIKPGADPQEILKVAENTWKEAGRTDSFIILAHSLGLRTEEFHFFDPMKGGASGINFENGNVFDLEAWTMLQGMGTVGNEDTYVVRNNKCERISTLEMKIYQK